MLKLFPEVGLVTAEERAMLAQFEGLPRPRQVSVKLVDLLIAVGLFIAANAFVMYCVLSSWPTSHRPSLIFLCGWGFLMICIPVVSAVRTIRDRRLLMDGEVALGRIFHISKGKGSRMEFRFEDRAGRTFTASREATPRDRSVSEGSAIVVFYDPANPEKRCVPSCRTLWKIDLSASASEIPRSANNA